MGVASLVLGILGIIAMVTVVIAPFGLIAVVVGLILGIVDAVKKGKTGEKKGISIAGIVICAIATVVLVVETLIVVMGLAIYTSASNSLLESSNDYSNSLNTKVVETFNMQYENYKGENSGVMVRTLLTKVVSGNNIYEDHIITCNLDGVTQMPSTLKMNIVPSYQYYITLNYDYQGYINQIDITTTTLQ